MKYIMLNKPNGCITARSDPRHKTVMDMLHENMRDTLFPVGRLDKDTEGLLLITDDGKLSHDLMSPENGVEKTYFFYFLGELDDEKIQRLEEGVLISEKSERLTSPARFSLLGKDVISNIQWCLSNKDLKKSNRRPNTQVFSATLTITEGKKHQVKKMILSVGCRILYLRRISIGSLKLDETLLPGEYRRLTEDEITSLKAITKK